MNDNIAENPVAGPPEYAFRPVRTRFLEALSSQQLHWPKVLSVVAPIGYGKTVLMSELFRHLQVEGGFCIWIGLDERDADIARVLDAIESRVRRRSSVELPLPAFLPGGSSLEARIEALVESLSRLPEQSTFFIDNLNSCSDPALGQLLDALIFRASPRLRFVWSSSSRLPFNFARAKLQGLIRQVGLADLSLNDREAHALLGAELGARIGALGIEALLQQTEGWPAAIRMAQIVLSDTREPLAALEAFSGSDEDIAALLNRHVLEGFAPELQAFLLGLAQLRVFNIDLARQATGCEEAAQHIDFLLQRNVFMIPLDRQRRHYRLHGLFRTYLLSEAERRLGEQYRQAFLRRAAQHCAKGGDLADAVDYALAAGDLGMASDLVERLANDAVRDRGEIARYLRWVERLLAAGEPIGWETEFWFAWALIFIHRYDDGGLQLDRLRQRLQAAAPDDPPVPENLQRRLDHLQVCVDLFKDRLFETAAGAERWFSPELHDPPFNLGSMYCIQAVCQVNGFQFAQARQTMQLAQSHKLQAGGPYGLGWTHLINSLIHACEGNYVRAYEDFGAGFPRIRQALGDDAGLTGSMALLGAKCAVEMGEDDTAWSLLQLGLRTVDSHGLVDTAACGFDAAVKLWAGPADERVLIPRLRELARNYPLRLSLMLSCFLVQRLISLGRLQEAIAEARWLGLGPEAVDGQPIDPQIMALPRYRDLHVATGIELDIATGKIRQAETAIARELKQAGAEGRVARQVELMLARARIGLCREAPAAAMKELVLAISLAARRRILRPFRTQGELVARVVHENRFAAWSFSAPEEQAFFEEVCSRLPALQGLEAQGGPRWNAEAGQSVALSKRELELLALVDMGLPNQKLAECLLLSVTTVKWHLQNLYRKLGVSTRSAALARARALNLLAK